MKVSSNFKTISFNVISFTISCYLFYHFLKTNDRSVLGFSLIYLSAFIVIWDGYFLIYNERQFK